MSGEASGQRGVELAGFWPRAAAQILDLAWLLPLFFILEGMGSLARGGRDLSPGADLMRDLILALVVLLFWVTRQSTPGKMVMRLRIVDARTGGTPDWTWLALRYLAYGLSSLLLGIGFLWMLWDPRRQCWHDKLARTLVVQDPPPRS